MKTPSVRSTDLWSGVLFVTIGTVCLVAILHNKMGNIFHMGPGYLPRALSIILTCVGLWLIVRSFWTSSLIEPMQLRTAIPILFATALFGLVLQSIGIFFASVSTILIASTGAGRSLKEILLLSIACAVVTTLGVYALHLPILLFPTIH